jgi:hypothetical protein
VPASQSSTVGFVSSSTLTTALSASSG